MTPEGITLYSDDTAALDRFEAQLRALAGTTEAIMPEPVVFYLKYTTADDATRMLGDLIDGAMTLSTDNGELIDGFVPSSSTGILGAFVQNRDGTTTMSAGSATVVADARLNRLIVQGTVADIELIEKYLKVIDKDSSLSSIETRGRSHVVELFHTTAADVAAVIRDAYAGRIVSGANQANSQRSNPSTRREPNQERAPNTEEREGRGNAGERQPERGRAPAQSSSRPSQRPTRSREPTMTVAVHEATNSLIITAPDQLFAEVESLIRVVDQRAEQSVQVLIPRTPINPRYVDEVLRRLLSGEGGPSNRAAPSRPTSSGQPAGATRSPGPSPPTRAPGPPSVRAVPSQRSAPFFERRGSPR